MIETTAEQCIEELLRLREDAPLYQFAINRAITAVREQQRLRVELDADIQLAKACAESERLRNEIGLLETRNTLLEGALLAVLEQHDHGHSLCECEMIRILIDEGE